MTQDIYKLVLVSTFYMDVAEGFVCQVNVPVLPRALMKPYVVVIYKEFILEFKEGCFDTFDRDISLLGQLLVKKGFPQK